MKAAVYSLDGKKGKEVELPEVFEEDIDSGLIKRAVLSIRSAKRQSYGVSKRSGKKTSAEYVGARHYPTVMRSINVGRARRKRTKNRRYLLYGRVAGIAGIVGGFKAHGPKSEHVLKEKINKKEKKKAVASAIAATARKEYVAKRRHLFELELPIVVDSKIEELKKTKEVREALKALKVWKDTEKTKQNKKIRAGKGKRRGRKYRKGKSLLIVVGKGKGIEKAAKNIEGVDVCEAKNLNAELLAPGTEPGRLTVYSESALKELKEMFEKEKVMEK